MRMKLYCILSLCDLWKRRGDIYTLERDWIESTSKRSTARAVQELAPACTIKAPWSHVTMQPNKSQYIWKETDHLFHSWIYIWTSHACYVDQDFEPTYIRSMFDAFRLMTKPNDLEEFLSLGAGASKKGGKKYDQGRGQKERENEQCRACVEVLSFRRELPFRCPSPRFLSAWSREPVYSMMIFLKYDKLCHAICIASRLKCNRPRFWPLVLQTLHFCLCKRCWLGIEEKEVHISLVSSAELRRRIFKASRNLKISSTIHSETTMSPYHHATK